MVNCFKKV